MVRLLSLVMLFFGVFMITQVVTPLVSFKLWEIKLHNLNQPLLSAVPSQDDILGVSIQDSTNFPAFISDLKRATPAPFENFYLSIPKLKLDNVEVKVDSNNFDQTLALLPGTALPGEIGNSFITGHSSAPLLSKSIKPLFVNLPQVQLGDWITLSAGAQRYDYQVINLKIVDPADLSVINPPDSTGRYLTLMTCVPPGTYTKRLIVQAILR